MIPEPFHETWSRIQDFEIDENEAALPFTARLARENGWTRAYAERVVDEYKKFLLLMVAAGHPVTPSDEIDQAWHLHLTYTHSYWDRLCGGTIGRPLHHGPTQGGQHEQQKFRRWYAKTLATYERFFASPPPVDIWPDPAIRFGKDIEFRRVNVRNNWVIPRPGLLSRTIAAGLLGVGLWTGLLASVGVGPEQPIVAQQIGGGNANDLWPMLLGLGAGAIVIAITAVIVHFVRQRRCPKCETSLSLHRTSDTKLIGGRKKIKWRCSNCAHVIWRRTPLINHAGGDSGCGGISAGDAGGWFDFGGGDGGCGGGGCGSGCGGM